MQVYLPEGRQREPQKEDKFKGIVEGEPVDDANEALDEAVNLLASPLLSIPSKREMKDVFLREKGKDNPVLKSTLVK